MTLESMGTAIGNFSFTRHTPEENAEIEAAWGRWCEEFNLQRRREGMDNAFVPSLYREASLIDEFGKPAKDGLAKQLWDWVMAPTDGVILTGPIGAGKTWLACAAMSAYMEKWNCSGRFVTAAKYSSEVIAYGIDRYYSPRVLILDDLGKEKPSEFVTQELFALIDHRVSTKRKTIITTNYGKLDLMERLTTGEDVTTAQAIASRLKSFKAFKVEGVDKR